MHRNFYFSSISRRRAIRETSFLRTAVNSECRKNGPNAARSRLPRDRFVIAFRGSEPRRTINHWSPQRVVPPRDGRVAKFRFWRCRNIPPASKRTVSKLCLIQWRATASRWSSRGGGIEYRVPNTKATRRELLNYKKKRNILALQMRARIRNYMIVNGYSNERNTTKSFSN